MFTLDQQLENDTFPVTELELCTVRLMNNAHYPWLILVPQRPDVMELIDLNADDQLMLWNEITYVSAYLRTEFMPDKLNVAALGNQVSQLHVHIIGRYTNDMAWPQPVWGKEPYPYRDDVKTLMMERLEGLVL